MGKCFLVMAVTAAVKQRVVSAGASESAQLIGGMLKNSVLQLRLFSLK